MSITVDGRVARAEDSGGIPAVIFSDLMSLVHQHGAMVVGRRTYELFRDLGAIETIPGRIVVISRTLERAPSVVIVGSPEDALEQLVEGGLAAAVLCGGVETYDSFLRLGVINELRLNVLPVLIGGGPRLADQDGPLGLDLVEALPLGGGIIQLRYSRSGPPS